MRGAWLLIAGWSVFLAVSVPATEYHRYTDDAGQVYFVDDISKIPERYLDTRETIQGYPGRPEPDDASSRAAAGESAAERSGEEMQPPAADTVATDILILFDQVLVPVVLGAAGLEFETVFLLDTGASMTAVHRSVADQLLLTTVKTMLAVTADGQEIISEISSLDYVRIGPHRIEDVKVGIIDYQGADTAYDGMLGMNLLKKVTYSIDYANQQIHWSRYTTVP